MLGISSMLELVNFLLSKYHVAYGYKQFYTK